MGPAPESRSQGAPGSRFTCPSCGATDCPAYDTERIVEQARARADASDVNRLAIDETAARRGHDYITLFVDIDRARVLFATEGRAAETVAAFADDLAAHGGDPDAVSEVCIDMSPPFIKGIAERLPNAAITFDKFHAVKIVNDAVDQVRRGEQKSESLLRGTRYIWLRNPANLSERQRATLDSLPTRYLKTARAYRIRLAFQELYDQPCGVAGKLSEAMVLLGHPQPARADDRGGAHRQTSLGWRPALVRQQDRQRTDRGHQQPHPGRQGQGSRLPINPQSQGDGLSARRQTRPPAASLMPFLPTRNSEEPYLLY